MTVWSTPLACQWKLNNARDRNRRNEPWCWWLKTDFSSPSPGQEVKLLRLETAFFMANDVKNGSSYEEENVEMDMTRS